LILFVSFGIIISIGSSNENSAVLSHHKRSTYDGRFPGDFS
jgi:hypothetical protein